MTTEDLLWNQEFEEEQEKENLQYSYKEEQAIEKYYEDKELFERFTEYFKPAS